MKLLVFAHTPPPHHGQSYMVKLMLDGLGGDRRRAAPGSPPPTDIECYHVNCRYSDNFEDIGSYRLEKMFLVLRYCLEAIWCRFRYGVRAFYYVPAPGKRAALYRDWVVMLLCRPFFRDFIHHWEAVGLGDWLNSEGNWFERWVTHRLLGRSTVGVSLAIPSMRDALWFRSRYAEVVANGIPDPCPDFETAILPRRRARLAARLRLQAGQPLADADRIAAGGDPEILDVLYLAHCSRDKGLFDAVDGVLAANKALQIQSSALRFRLTVAGGFLEAAEEQEFQASIAAHSTAIRYAGFVSGEAKAVLLASSDAFCFPTYYPAEGQPVCLIEAIAYGLPIVTTRWRAIPEILPPDYAGFVAQRSPAQVATALVAAAVEDGAGLREHFLARYTLEKYVRGLRDAFRIVEAAVQDQEPVAPVAS
ncbi:MAG: glycosyltransferase [Chthoniobacter sp.]|uniref:glycosyltransferase family 4 protein n=1 Tax=Chthoniobacter sp. TaxID=2510640 RepID=UPI0032ABDE2F